jgi:hypothetical protein
VRWAPAVTCLSVKKAIDTTKHRKVDGRLVKAFWSVAEIAALAGTTRHRMMRIFQTHRIVPVRSGRVVLIALSDLEDRLPQILAAIETVARIEQRVRENRPLSPEEIAIRKHLQKAGSRK